MARPSLAAVAALLLVSLPSANAFTAGRPAAASYSRRSQQQLSMAQTPPSPEESARALSDYMAKSHEEKLKAVKAVEDKKNAEIEDLKKEIASMKTSTSGAVSDASPLANLPEGSRDELATKLQAYQKFMAEYIVKAQEEKVRAIKAAEVAAERKYEEKLLLLGGGDAPALAVATPAQIPKLYADRNAKISAAAKAGKSRWGAMETEKSMGLAGVSGPAAVNGAAAVAAGAAEPVAPAPATIPGVVPPEVEAADHGLRADGGVGGLTLAERVALGAGAGAAGASVPAASIAIPAQIPKLYSDRNAKISAAAKAGKSRWGEMEIKKSMGLAGVSGPAAVNGAAAAVAAEPIAPAPATVPGVVPPEVEAADHGLRADGGVGGLTLAERVALGAGAGAAGAVVAAASPASHSLYDKRNAMVTAAGKAGKSRWGEMEIKKLTELTGRALSGSGAPAPAVQPSPEVINLGARLLQNA